MSIRPVDFNGMIQNSHDVSNMQQHEENRGVVQQQNVTTEFVKEVEVKPKRVNEQENADKSGDSTAMKDAKEKGNGSYQPGNGKKKQEKKQDKIILKGSTSSFDIKI